MDIYLFIYLLALVKHQPLKKKTDFMFCMNLVYVCHQNAFLIYRV